MCQISFKLKVQTQITMGKTLSQKEKKQNKTCNCGHVCLSPDILLGQLTRGCLQGRDRVLSMEKIVRQESSAPFFPLDFVWILMTWSRKFWKCWPSASKQTPKPTSTKTWTCSCHCHSHSLICSPVLPAVKFRRLLTRIGTHSVTSLYMADIQYIQVVFPWG